MISWTQGLYLPMLLDLITRRTPTRTTVALRPRRAGKTVMLIESVYELIASGIDPMSICYAAVENPVYTGRSLDSLLALFVSAHDHKRRQRQP